MLQRSVIHSQPIMAVNLSVTELSGKIDANGKLSVDETLPVHGPVPVRVWVMLESENDDIDEKLWLTSLSNNPALSDLTDPTEDIYTLKDGKPFRS
jgi:hypothetical protein